MQAISALKRKGVASMCQFVPWHKLSIVCKSVCSKRVNKVYVMYVLALSDYKEMSKACCCRGLKTRPPIRQTISSLSKST